APEAEMAAGCLDVPLPCRSRVHVFFLQSLDPLDLANLAGVESHVRSLGFIKTWFGQPYHVTHFADAIRKLHEDDPEVRFALVGFGKGARSACELAASFAPEAIPIDLLVALAPADLDLGPRPGNLARVVRVVPGAPARLADGTEECVGLPDAGL